MRTPPSDGLAAATDLQVGAAFPLLDERAVGGVRRHDSAHRVALTAGREWFKPWRTVTGEGLAEGDVSELEVMVQGVFSPDRLLPLVHDFIVFEDDGGPRVKKVAG